VLHFDFAIGHRGNAACQPTLILVNLDAARYGSDFFQVELVIRASQLFNLLNK